MSLDLNKLETKLDKALFSETSETLNNFLKYKRMTNETKQTAVDWLIEELGEYFPHGIGGIEHMVKQAKEIEKEQHGKTWDCAIDNLNARGGNVVRAWADFDDYYNENYGGKK